MKLQIWILVAIIVLGGCREAKTQNGNSVIWEINALEEIGGHSVEQLGEPVVIDTPEGKAVEFDGIDDGLIVDNNPVAGAEEFTVEVIFKPYASDSAENIEQRFVHMQESDDKRLLIELRLTNDNQWFLDTFIKADNSNKTLYAENFPHPIGGWHHAALVYKNGIMTHFVDSVEEMSGEVNYTPMQSGQTSIGVRINKRSWFKGAIRRLRVTPQALNPDEFLISHVNVEIDESVIRAWALAQNIPNPFNQTTQIAYDIPQQSQVRLKVLNMLGQTVATLVDEIQKADHYCVNFDAGDLSSGTYIYQLNTGTEMLIRKMTYLK